MGRLGIVNEKFMRSFGICSACSERWGWAALTRSRSSPTGNPDACCDESRTRGWGSGTMALLLLCLALAMGLFVSVKGLGERNRDLPQKPEVR